ncbi:hypothetical protein CRENBAI_008804 [Crenichthys baileyi]|uniref:Uncharacterized protein n=1 Tax=Crenichthys baileyi TaxID=28760 RepID=A0AAV9RMP9_9TELE
MCFTSVLILPCADTSRCMTSGSDGVDQRLEVNQFEPIPGLNLWADSSASLQPSESCPPSQHLPFGPSRQPRQVKLPLSLSHHWIYDHFPRRISLRLPPDGSCLVSRSLDNLFK